MPENEENESGEPQNSGDTDDSSTPEQTSQQYNNNGILSDIDLGITNRRSVIAGLTGLGLLGVSGSAQADSDVDALQTAMEFGGSYSGSTPNGYGLELEETTSDGSFTTGLQAFQNSSSGAALFGRAESSTGNASGVVGRSNAANGRGIIGRATNTSGNTIGLLGIADSSQGTGLQGEARSSSGGTVGLRGVCASPGGDAVRAEHQASSGTTYAVRGQVASPDGYGLYTPDDAKIDGNLEVGGTKHFVQAVETPSGTQEVAYTAVEAGKARTEVSDIVELVDGKAVIELPDHFQMVTSKDEPLTVQITPYAKQQVHPQVVDQSIDEIVVKDFGDGPDEYTISYTAKGIREGFEDEEIVR
jgi:hypothetical protein